MVLVMYKTPLYTMVKSFTDNRRGRRREREWERERKRGGERGLLEYKWESFTVISRSVSTPTNRLSAGS